MHYMPPIPANIAHPCHEILTMLRDVNSDASEPVDPYETCLSRQALHNSLKGDPDILNDNLSAAAEDCYALLLSRHDIAATQAHGTTYYSITPSGLTTLRMFSQALDATPPAPAPTIINVYLNATHHHSTAPQHSCVDRAPISPVPHATTFQARTPRIKYADKESRIKAAQCEVLKRIQDAGVPLTFSDLKKASQFSEVSIFDTLRTLVDNKYLEKSQSETDIRKRPYAITASGSAYLKELQTQNFIVPKSEGRALA